MISNRPQHLLVLCLVLFLLAGCSFFGGEEEVPDSAVPSEATATAGSAGTSEGVMVTPTPSADSEAGEASEATPVVVNLAPTPSPADLGPSGFTVSAASVPDGTLAKLAYTAQFVNDGALTPVEAYLVLPEGVTPISGSFDPTTRQIRYSAEVGPEGVSWQVEAFRALRSPTQLDARLRYRFATYPEVELHVATLVTAAEETAGGGLPEAPRLLPGDLAALTQLGSDVLAALQGNQYEALAAHACSLVEDPASLTASAEALGSQWSRLPDFTPGLGRLEVVEEGVVLLHFAPEPDAGYRPLARLVREESGWALCALETPALE